MELCSNTPDVPGQWDSRLAVLSRNATSLQLSWSMDDTVSSPMYIVQYQQEDTRPYNTAEGVLTHTMHTHTHYD